MNWKQYFIDYAPFLTFAAYTWAVCFFFYRLNERNIEKSEGRFEKSISETKEIIKEWREEHRQQMDKMDAKIDKMDSKWERLFERLLLQDQQKIKS